MSPHRWHAFLGSSSWLQNDSLDARYELQIFLSIFMEERRTFFVMYLSYRIQLVFIQQTSICQSFEQFLHSSFTYWILVGMLTVSKIQHEIVPHLGSPAQRSFLLLTPIFFHKGNYTFKVHYSFCKLKKNSLSYLLQAAANNSGLIYTRE